MLLEEFDEEKYLKTVEARGREEGIQIGKERGREEGIQIGETRRQITTAQKLLENHVDRKIILASTGLTEEELNKIEQGKL